MRNSVLFIIFLLTIFITVSLNCRAQIIDNKINLYGGYERGRFYGNGSINENNFIYPSLYPNLKSLNGISLKILYNHPIQFFGFGVTFTHLKGIGWKSPDSPEYNGSKVILHSLSPTIQIHSKLTGKGVFNRFRLFFEIAPGIGLSKLTLSNPIFDIQSGNSIISQPMNSFDLFYGFKRDSGIELAINQNVNVYFSYSYSRNWIKSKLYADKHFSSSCLSLGAILRLRKIKQLF
ncbi:MAG: hypothetical protein GX660_17015 [Clostridiaceae bacterium]|nr:hypothetical protein [Clostridiaceae bacterium]